MKSKTIYILALVLLISHAVAVFPQDEGDYSVQKVKSLLALPPTFSTSVTEKDLNRMGDRISIALLKIYSDQELIRPENLMRYLPMIRAAFQAAKIVPPDDRQPRVTLLLLDSLLQRVQQQALRKEVLTTKKAVLDSTDTAYSIRQISKLLKQTAGNPSDAANEEVSHLGDRVAIAITKIYKPQELQDPANIQKYLPLLEAAFRSPDRAPAKDREPRITLFLLNFLKSHIDDPELGKKILDVESTVEKRSRDRRAVP